MMGDGEVGFKKLSGPMQLIVLFLSSLGIIVPCVLGFVNFDARLDNQEYTTSTHIGKDEKKWEKVDESIEHLKEQDHILALQSARTEINQKEILRRLEEMRLIMSGKEIK